MVTMGALIKMSINDDVVDEEMGKGDSEKSFLSLHVARVPKFDYEQPVGVSKSSKRV